MLLVHVVPFLS